MLAELVGLVADGTISAAQAKDVLAESLREEKWPRDIVEARGLAQVSDEGELAAVVDEVLAANADVVDEYRAGDDDRRRRRSAASSWARSCSELEGQGQRPGPQPAPRRPPRIPSTRSSALPPAFPVSLHLTFGFRG